jgi:F-type H+-transporting ATPase subunit delta
VKNLRVSNRYAKALLGLAEENNFAERAFQDMELIFITFQESKELQTILKSPIVRISKKLNILNAVFGEKINPITLQYLNIITRKKRGSLIPGIAYEYLKLYRENLDLELVTLITAGEINDELAQKAYEIATSITPKANIEFRHIYNEDIIGGFILRVGDTQYDASVRRKLSNIKKRLLEM